VRYHCGLDIGGTFTDCVVINEEGVITQVKTSSTPPNFAEGFFQALTDMAEKLGHTTGEFLANTDLLLHGTTVGTNVLVQRRGAKAGLITTRGHRDVLLMMRSYGRSAGLPIEQLLRVSKHRKPEPLIPPELIREVSERVDWAGDVVLPLNEDEARAAIQELIDQGVEAIAISFLWDFVNPDHELRVKAMVEEMAPDVFISCAHELIALPGEYERTAAAAINAFIGPETSRYVNQVNTGTDERGLEKPLLIMQAAGGVGSAADAAAKPLFTIGSGPVGGVTGAAYLAERMDQKNVIASDMGGTSFDVGIVADGSPLMASETIVNQYTFFMPRLDIISIGAGGGSLVWAHEDSNTLRVGPKSAGAQPGPACYRRGGTEPTVTDCDLLLGRYNAEAFLGGDLSLDVEASRKALEAVADRVGMDLIEAAEGAVRIVDSQMADLMRQMTVERGLDPRDFVIQAFGGACAAHAVGFARELGCSQVVVPLGALASTWSALGVMTSDVLHIRQKSGLLSAPFSPEALNTAYEGLEDEVRGLLADGGFGEEAMVIERTARMKFDMQIHEIDVAVEGGKLDEQGCEEQVGRFIETYEQTFGEGSAFAGAGVQIGGVQVVGRGRVGRPVLPEIEGGDPSPSGNRDVYWRELGGFHPTDVYDETTIAAGATIEGPAVIDLPVTTVVLPPDTTATVDPLGSIVIDVGTESVVPAEPLDPQTGNRS
jgi:N-methylhydantoinase A